MVRSRKRSFCVVLLVMSVCATAACGAFTQPWDTPVADNWILPDELSMYAYDGSTYPVSFNDLPSDPAKNWGRGMNSLRFRLDGSIDGHMSSSAPAGAFEVTNIGDNQAFTDLLLLVAVDAASLPGTFSMALGPSGGAAQTLSGTDFAWHDAAGAATGRPTGYHSLTDPIREEIAYDFSSGMVTVVPLTDLNVAPFGGTVEIDYDFTDLPGRAVFSVYGFFDDGNVTTTDWIMHTNRGIPDTNPNPKHRDAVSTFEVDPSGGKIPEPSVVAMLGAAAAWVLRRRRSMIE